MRKTSIIVYLLLPILLLTGGWVIFSRYIRPSHYQLLYPYSVFQFRSESPVLTRFGMDNRIQLYIPEGSAVVGKDNYVEEVSLKPFWIDQIPVTAGDYKRFLAETGSLAPRYRDQYTKYWIEKRYELQPVIFVSWGQAEDYCEHYGGHLPTEAQWEKAARGPEGIVLYWDDSEKAFDHANYDRFFHGLTFSGWLPRGKTIYGALDMSGNVREWVLDWFTAPDYKIRMESWEILRSEESVSEGNGRILKGGSFTDDLSHLRLNFRDAHDPTSPGVNRGFRCIYEK